MVVVDVEMKDASSPAKKDKVVNGVEEEQPKDPELLTLEDVRDYVKYIEKAVSTKEPRYMSRVTRGINSIRNRLNANVLRRLLQGYIQSQVQVGARDEILAFLDQPMEVNGISAPFRPRSAKAASNPVIPEIEVYLHLLVLIHLIDLKKFEKNIHGLRARKAKEQKPSNSKNLTLTTAERAKRYREQRKNDPVFKEKERLRKKIAWHQRTEKQKERDKEHNRKNQERYRERQKIMGVEAKRNPSKVLTRSEREKKREYWRRKQKESRANKHPQKIRRKKEKDRERKKKQKLIVKVKAIEKQGGECTNDKKKAETSHF